jgi:TetR/AcrR family transcriptional regulator, transcriptional repressor for nem operon
MARPKEFDVDAALDVAKTVFWEKGYEATSTEDLRRAMGIGRQSFYDSFGGKRDVFLAALRRYVVERFDETARVLESRSPLAGIERLLRAVAQERPAQRARGCLGVSSMCELGAEDGDVRSLFEVSTARVIDAIAACLRRVKDRGEADPHLPEHEAAAHLHATLVGMRVLAKGGARPDVLHGIASRAVLALRPVAAAHSGRSR